MEDSREGGMTVEEIYQVAKEYKAVMSPLTTIRWVEMEPYGGMWVKGKISSPSILDALILDRAACVPNYMTAAKMATGWSEESIVGFQRTMLLGHPMHETEEVALELSRWRGICTALELYNLVKRRDL